MQRLIVWLKNLALTLCTLIVLGLVLELCIRGFSSIPPRLLLRQADIGGAYVPSVDIELLGPESGQRIHFKTNRDGFRGKDLNHPKPDNTFRIAVLGDSQMAAVNTPEPSIFASQLENALQNTFPAYGWQVMNYSVSGASTGQELNLYQKRIKSYQPDLVIAVYYNGNDFTDNSKQLSSNPRVYLSLEEDGTFTTHLPSVSSGLVNWVKQNSRF